MNSNGWTRNQEIVRYNIMGVVLNLVLSVFKIVIGAASAAHAVILDGVNGLSDMTSSLLTIASVYLGKRKASRNYPLGFGRLEYVFSLFITSFIIFIGVRSVIDSINTILHPDSPPDYNFTVVIIMVVSLAAKLVYGTMLQKKGKQLDSIAMRMAGVETIGDALINAAVLAAIVVYNTTRLDIEQYLCIGVSALIIYNGVKMVLECMTKIIGTRVDPDFKKKIMNLILTEKGVENVSNLVIHSYGENVFVGSVDIMVDEKMPAAEISLLSRRVIRRAEKAGLILTSVGVCGINYDDDRVYQIRDIIIEKARADRSIAGVGSCVIDFEEKVISFYVIPAFGIIKREEALQKFKDELGGLFPDMTIDMIQTIDI